MNHRYIIPALIAISTLAAAAESFITGSIIDPDGEPLTGTSVSIYSLPDTILIDGTTTDIDGRYTLPVKRKGRYHLKYQMLGTQPASINVEINDTTDSLVIDPIMLAENAEVLQEVVVRGVKTAVIAREDTLEYNAGSYHTKVNANVEDLLKKLPGVEISSDGSITAGGKSVTKILVDGKEFFGDDPTAATKNLPSDMVDKVQVINQKSDLARLTGVDDGEEETVINLSVKKNMRNGWFGNLQGEYGTDDRYQYSFNINRFHNGNQITLLGGGNNINQMGFNDRGRNKFGGQGGSSGINNNRHIGLNFNVGKEEKLRVGGNVMYSYSDRKVIQSSATQYLFPDSTSYLNSYRSSRDRGHNVNADFRVQWKIDDNNTLDFRPRFSYSHRNRESNDTSTMRAGDALRSIVNHNDNLQRTTGDSYDISGNLIFNHNFASRPGRSLSVQARYSFTDSRQYDYSWSRIKYYLLDNDDESLYRYLDTRTWSSSVDGRLTWTEPLGNPANGNFLTLAYSVDYRWNNADKMTYNLSPDLFSGSLDSPGSTTPDGVILDTDLSNRFRNRFFNQDIQLGYKRVSKSFNLQGGLILSPSSSSSENLIDHNKDIPRRSVFNIAPFLRLRWKFSQSSSLVANYRARTSQPSMTQLQPVADISDPMNIKVGNPDLKPSFAQTLMLHYNDFNTDAQRSIFAMLNARYTTNDIATKNVTDHLSGVRTTTYENVNGNWSLMAMAMLTQPLRNRSWRINAHLNTNYTSTAGFINGEKNRSGNLRVNPRAGITFSSEIFQFTLGPSYSLQLATASLPSQPDRTIHTYGFDADASLYLPFGLELTTDLSMSRNTGYAAGYNNNQWLWNAQLSYSLLRDKSLTLSLSVYDILQQKRNISRSVTAASIVDSRINDLTRYAMFTLTWKFNSFGSSNDIPQMDNDRRGHHMGEPGMRPPRR